MTILTGLIISISAGIMFKNGQLGWLIFGSGIFLVGLVEHIIECCSQIKKDNK